MMNIKYVHVRENGLTYIISALTKAQADFQSLLFQALVINICALIIIAGISVNLVLYINIGYQSYCIYYRKVEYVVVKTLCWRYRL